MEETSLADAALVALPKGERVSGNPTRATPSLTRLQIDRMGIDPDSDPFGFVKQVLHFNSSACVSESSVANFVMGEGGGAADEHWRAYIFYVNAADPRILVPKRNEYLGWTL